MQSIQEDSQYYELRCIIANDEQFILDHFAKQLRQYFSVVDIAENGQSAINHVISHPNDYYDFIFLDIGMPIMDGVESCKMITRHLHGKSLSSLLLFGSKDKKVDKEVAPIEDKAQQRRKKPKIIAVTADVRKENVEHLMRQNFS